MLVVTSNWCAADGSLSAGPAPGLVALFRAEVRLASLRAGVRGDGSYRPASGIAVIFAGDTFDWLTSREWAGDVRPWETTRRAAAARERVAIRSLQLAGRLIATLSSWARLGLRVPEADRRGRPRLDASVRVPVRISLLRGDRDRWLDRWAAPIAGPVAVGNTWTHDAVTVRHGEECEFPWHADGREPTLGESLAVDLVTRFGGWLADDVGPEPRVAVLLRRLVAGRLLDAPVRLWAWLAARQRHGIVSAMERSRVVDGWNRSVCGWHRAARRLGLGRCGGIDVLDDVAAAMTLGHAADGDRHSGPHGPGEAGTARPPRARAAACEILGHPPAGSTPASAGGGRVLCIGPPAVSRPGGGPPQRAGSAWPALFDPPGMPPRIAAAVEPLAPAAAVVAVGPAGPWLDWLSIGGAAAAAHGGHDESEGLGVWRSTASGRGNHVVDAA